VYRKKKEPSESGELLSLKLVWRQRLPHPGKSVRSDICKVEEELQERPRECDDRRFHWKARWLSGETRMFVVVRAALKEVSNLEAWVSCDELERK
jgi:hypothetical protein